MIDDATRDKNPRVIKGQTASMTCPVSGIPFPSIQWLKNNQEVTVDGRTEVMNSGLVLRIANATEADTALYTCFVISPAGEDRANYNLVVLGTLGYYLLVNHYVVSALRKPCICICFGVF